MLSPHTPEYRRFLVRFRKAREDARMTQRQVAEALGIPQPRVARMETGERRIDVVELLTFAKLYRKSLAYFVRGV